MVLFEVFINLRLSAVVYPCVGKHLRILLQHFLIVEAVVDDIEHSIAEIDEAADDEQFEGMLADPVVQNFLLVCPIEDQAGSILEMQLLVVYAVELEKKVN